MENQRESIELLLANRLHLYEVFHVVFSGVPNEELIHCLSDEQTGEAFAILSDADDDMMAKMSRFTKKLEGHLAEDEMYIDKLKTEYTRLYVGPGRMVAYPWESTYNGKENLLFQESTLRVRQFYRKYGYLPQEYPHVADDHIALEMHFMSKLSQRALEAFQADNLQEACNMLKGQQMFMKYHLLNWLPKYVAAVSDKKTGYTTRYKTDAYLYPQFIMGVDAFVAVDNDFVAEAIEWMTEAMAPSDAE